MLTDYHVHLRKDIGGLNARDAFSEENLNRYLKQASKRGVKEIGFSEHIYRFKEGLALCSDEFWTSQATDSLPDYVDFVSQTPARLGIEVDFIPGREMETAEILNLYPFDYVIGSVHTISGLPFCNKNNEIWTEWPIEKIWQEYFQILGEAILSGLFDIIAHPDLVKVHGLVPRGDLVTFYQPALEAIAATRPVVEVSTAGLRKSIGEIYPSKDFLKLAVQAGASISLSSDAHSPKDVGAGYLKALDLLKSVGVQSLAVFDQREYRPEPIF